MSYYTVWCQLTCGFACSAESCCSHKTLVFFITHLITSYMQFITSPFCQSLLHSPSLPPFTGTARNFLSRGTKRAMNFSPQRQHETTATGGYPRLCHHTHTTVLCPFFQVSRCQQKSSSRLYGAREDNRGRHIDKSNGCHSIHTNQWPTSIITLHFYAGCPSCHNPPTLSWLGTGTKYAGFLAYTVTWLHTQICENVAGDLSWLGVPDRFPQPATPCLLLYIQYLLASSTLHGPLDHQHAGLLVGSAVGPALLSCSLCLQMSLLLNGGVYK